MRLRGSAPSFNARPPLPAASAEAGIRFPHGMRMVSPDAAAYIGAALGKFSTNDSL
jgi:hypothetical protein